MFIPIKQITFARLLSLVSLNLLGALALRMMITGSPAEWGNRKQWRTICLRYATAG